MISMRARFTINEEQGNYCNMVDPNEIGSAEGESISTPDVLGVQVADLNVLDNYVLAIEAQTLALYDTLGTNTEDCLVGSDLDG